MPSGATLRGKAEMAQRIRNEMIRNPRRFGRALYQETEIERTECVRRTPRDTGELRSSEHVEGPEYKVGNRIRCSIVAGGPSAPYAVIVHEDLDAYHPIGEAKYIERPLMESRPYLAARIARRLRENG